MEKKKRSKITQKQRMDWLERYEQGESPPKIAGEQYDVRTVRSHIQRARQEREVKEARANVLRNALEQHYEDLCEFAAKLDPLATKVVARLLPADDETMEIALRQHLPRSPIWNLLLKKTRLEEESTSLIQQVEEELEQAISGESKLKQLEATGLSGIIPGITQFFSKQLEAVSEKFVNISVPNYLRVDPDGEVFNLQLGFSQLESIEEKEDADHYLEVLQPIIEKLIKDMRNSDSLKRLTQINDELIRTNRKLHEEISIIRLRRIIPGKCKFCPL